MGAAAVLSALTGRPHGTATRSSAAKEMHGQRILRPALTLLQAKRILLQMFKAGPKATLH
jgi:hypothetical protein